MKRFELTTDDMNRAEVLRAMQASRDRRARRELKQRVRWDVVKPERRHGAH